MSGTPGSAAASKRSEADDAGHAAGDAERVAEEWAERIGRWVLRAAVRAREEAEDIWAEAQALRRER
jgi:hypothetical protein